MSERDYSAHAQSVAASIGLKVKIRRADHQTCPGWARPCDHLHGLRYEVTLTNTRGACLTFPFWGSMHDRAQGQAPDVYDVLSCVSSDASLPTDPDTLVEELGPMKPSRAFASVEHTKRLRAFFLRAELRRLAEVQ